MDLFRKLIKFCILALLIFAIGCEEGEEKESGNRGDSEANSERVSTNGRNTGLLTPDKYNADRARQNGYTVIHQDTDTSPDDERCGNGGGRYSRTGQSACEIFNHQNDWYSSNQAKQTNCPNGLTRVDQSGIGRENLAGSTRQCRTNQQINTGNEVAHFYCPHGPNLLGTRTGAAAARYGPCQLKCDPDVRHLYARECGISTSANSNQRSTTATQPSTPTTIYIPQIRVPVIIPPTTPSSTPSTSPPPIHDPAPLSADPTLRIPIEEPPTRNELLPDFPALTIKSAPDEQGIHVIKVKTWFWIDPAQWMRQQKVLDYEEQTYTTTATPSALTITITGPIEKTINCGTKPGQAWNSESSQSQCSYAWEKPGVYMAVATIHWATNWICQPDCGSGSFEDVSSHSLNKTFRVTEVQALVQSE